MNIDLMLHTLSALEPTWTITTICPACLLKGEMHTRQRPTESEVSVVCRNCSRTMDAPIRRTDTGVY